MNKTWDDNNNQAGLRPDSITVALLANGKEIGKTIELNKDNDWKGEFNDLPSHNNGKLIKIHYQRSECREWLHFHYRRGYYKRIYYQK